MMPKKMYIKFILFNSLLFFTLQLLYVPNMYSQEQNFEDYFEMSIKELMNIKVVTSSREKEKILDAPNTIYVISAEEIKRRGFKSFHDILIVVPGFNAFLGDMGFFTQVRGIAPNSHNKVTYMINGQAFNQLSEANLLSGPVTFDNVEQVEIIVGPGSVLYGAETLLAIVNVITKKETTREITIRGGQDLGVDSEIFGYKNASAYIAKKWNEKTFINASFSIMEQDGWDALDSVNIANPKYLDLVGRNIFDKYYPSYFFTTNLSYDNYQVQFISYNAEQSDIGRSQEFNQEGRRIDHVDDFSFQHQNEWNENITSNLLAGYSNKRFVRMTTEGFGQTTDLSETKYRAEYSLKINYNDHFLQAGIQYNLKKYDMNYLFDWNPEDPAGSADSGKVQQFIENRNVDAIGFFVSDSWKLSNELRLVAASRFDYSGLFVDQIHISPRLAIILRPTTYWTSKLMYNTSTHMPDQRQSSMNMLFGADKPDIAPPWAQSNVLAEKPERLQAFEFRNIVRLGNHFLSANIFYQRLDNFISWFNPSTNMGDFTGYGFEADWKAYLSKWINAWANVFYSQTDFNLTAVKYQETSNFPSNNDGESVSVPGFTFNCGVDLKLSESVFISIISRYFTKQPAYFLEINPEDQESRIGKWGYVNNQIYLDATLLIENVVSKNIDFSLSAKNITNNQDLIGAQYRLFRYTPRGISIYSTIRYRF